MGYHLTILRSAHGRQVPISLDEAERAAHDLGWAFDDSVEPTIVRESAESEAVLWYQHDELWTKNPNDWAIGEIIALARTRGACVRGDRYETYASL